MALSLLLLEVASMTKSLTKRPLGENNSPSSISAKLDLALVERGVKPRRSELTSGVFME